MTIEYFKLVIFKIIFKSNLIGKLFLNFISKIISLFISFNLFIDIMLFDNLFIKNSFLNFMNFFTIFISLIYCLLEKES